MLGMLYLLLLVVSVYGEIVQVSIPEEVPLGTFVTKLMFNGEYKLYDYSEPYFTLDYDGTISTKSHIDRELPPFNDPDAPYDLKVLHGQNLIQVFIDVIDINDNRPLFKTKQETFSILESINVGYEKMLPDAVDIDFGINSTQGYRIASGNIDNTFEIVVEKQANKNYFNLRVKRPLDREVTPEFNLEVVAYDGAYPPKEDTLYVNVIVEDENDCSPEFNQSQYYASVKENAPIGHKIVTVLATDRDSGSNGRIVYSFERGLPGTNLFMIDKYKGHITLQGKLDYETTDTITLRVIASDEATNPRTSKAWVTIELEDVNDNDPEILILFKSSTDTVAHVDEDAVPNSPVVTISVTDKDSGRNADVTCEMKSERGMEYFKLVKDPKASNIWYVQVRKSPKRDVARDFTLSVTARDNGRDEQRVQHVQFKVTITDINDHYPMFDPPSYSTSILENTSPGTDIIKVKATDDDDGAFGDITYRIKSVSAQDTSTDPLTWFDITPKTGIIRNRIKLDREKTPDIHMVIQAVDGGTAPNGPHIATATVLIKLLDENDNIPLFPQSQYTANIKNNVPVGEEVIQVLARDYDDGTFGAVDYSIDTALDSTLDSIRYFKIHRSNGMISVSSPLPDMDYQVVTLQIDATDGGGRTGKCEVRISMFGDNNYSPVMGRKLYQISVNENVIPPRRLVTVSATDQDPTYFGEVHYQLQGNTNGKFEIDRETGEISVVKPLDYESTVSYKFYVRAYNNDDGTSDKREATATVQIIVNDINDEPPQFAYRRYNLTAYTEDKNGTIIETIEAVDPDSANSGKVTYRLIGGNAHMYFKLRSTPAGAQIIINGNLEYMAGKTVNLRLEAQDDNQETFNGDQTLLWVSIIAGKGVYATTNTRTWLDRYLPFVIGVGVFVALIFIIILVVICNRSQKQREQFTPGKLPAYDGYEYADFDEQVGLEPDTVKAYNIDGGGECDRLSAFEALTNQLQSLQYDYIDKPKNYTNYFDYNDKKLLDSEGYFSLSDPAFNESPKYNANKNDSKNYINKLLNSQNIYSNMPVKCDSKYMPLSPPPDCKEFVRSLPPLENHFVPMSPDLSTHEEGFENLREDYARHARDEYGAAGMLRSPDIIPSRELRSSLSSLVSSQSRANEFTRLPTSLLDNDVDQEPESSRNEAQVMVRTSNLSLNSDVSTEF